MQFAWFLAGSWLSSFQQPVASRRISWSARSGFSVRRSPKAKKNPKRSLIICSLPLPLLSASLSFVRSRRPVSVRGVHARRTVSPEATSCDQRKKKSPSGPKRASPAAFGEERTRRQLCVCHTRLSQCWLSGGSGHRKIRAGRVCNDDVDVEASRRPAVFMWMDLE